jgi:hypothetical protein
MPAASEREHMMAAQAILVLLTPVRCKNARSQPRSCKHLSEHTDVLNLCAAEQEVCLQQGLLQPSCRGCEEAAGGFARLSWAPVARACRSICKGVLEALAFCHKRGVAHGSLGPGSILLSTFRDQQARDLIVKLDNFGFAQLHRPGVPSVFSSWQTKFSVLRQNMQA